MYATTEDALGRGGVGRFQRRLLMIFGLVWAADAMQVLAVGFAAPSVADSFGVEKVVALQIGTVFFLGMFLGAIVCGRLADRIGRKPVLMATVAMDAVFGCASAMVGDFTWLLVLRFLTGIAVGGTLPVDYAMMAEFLPLRHRGRWLVWLEGFWAIGTIVLALVVWAITSLGVVADWRWIFVASSVPALVGLVLRFWVPESPLYLMRTGQEQAARDVITRMLRVNRAPALPAELRLQNAKLPISSQAQSAIWSPKLRKTTGAILAVWFLLSLAYYGVFVWVPGHLVGQGFGFVRGYGFLVLLALAQLPGYALAAWGVDAVGRRPTLAVFLLISAVSCGVFFTVHTDIMAAVSLLLLSFALLGSWGALYAVTPLLYPTALRATGMGAAGAMARLGGILAPSLLAVVFEHSFSLAIGVVAVLLLVAAAVTVTAVPHDNTLEPY